MDPALLTCLDQLEQERHKRLLLQPSSGSRTQKEAGSTPPQVLP